MLGQKIYRGDKLSSLIINEGSGLYYYFNYPKIYIKNNSVDISKLDSSMLPVLEVLTKTAFKFGLTGFIITSGNDGSHGGSSGTNSLHYKNRAIDISFREAVKNTIIEGISTSSSSIIKFIRESLNNKLLTIDFDVVVESNHVHIEYDPKKAILGYVDEKLLPQKINEGGQFESTPIKYVHTDPTVKTLSNLLSSSILFSKYKNSINDLLSYKGKTNKTNRERIESMYEDDTFDTLKLNTVLYLDPDKLDRNVFIEETTVTDVSNFPMFFSKLREDLESEKGYIQPKFYQTQENWGVEYVNHIVSVWVYSKSLSKIIDITSLCNNVTVNSTLKTSSFNVICNISPNIDTTINIYYPKLSYIQKNITSNDVIWIRFETLENEDRDNEEVSFTEIAGKNYDFMGFVDTVIPEMNLGDSSGSVVISGQCFSKLFIDDEAIFFPLATVKDSKSGNLIIGQFENDKILKRLFSDGTFNTLFSKQYRTIKDSLLFYINQLSNTGLVPDNINDLIFQSYKDRRKKPYRLKGEEVTQVFTNGVYQVIDIVFDESIKDRTIVDSTVHNPNGSIMSLFNKICQEPLVEFLMDTYRDMYSIVVRKPPFDKGSIKSWLERDNSIYTLDISDVSYENLSFEDSFYTWFQINNTGVFWGDSQSVSLSYIPIVPIPKYIEYWGSKRRVIESNYTRSNTFGTVEEKRQVMLDLLYVMECDIYLPFSRKGTIVLSKGDRRIKKGTWIRYNGEIFYINSVINSASITDKSVSRTTTLNVSRGLKEDHIEGEMSYFNIINFDNLKQTLSEFLLNDKDRGSIINRNIIVNDDVFDYFLKKRQFDE